MEKIIIGIVALILILLIIEYNKFARLKNKVKQSKSTIDVYLNKRFDLIPNLVECVKGYSNYESSLFTRVTELREKYTNTSSIKDGEETYKEFSKVFATIEKYPELKASENFLNLQKNLADIEDELQAARRLYNGDVTLYNTTLITFPNNLLAAMFGFRKEELFQIDDEKKENIKINL